LKKFYIFNGFPDAKMWEEDSDATKDLDWSIHSKEDDSQVKGFRGFRVYRESFHRLIYKPLRTVAWREGVDLS
jgi:hypothetical protein